MGEYIFKIKKQDVEIEVVTDDKDFLDEQLQKWRDTFFKQEN